MNAKNFQMPRFVQIDEESLSDDYGLFSVQPLERGFGATIGNALRRVLLSSIEGAAVKAVKIEGIQHEFTVIEGVVEDVTEVVLNLKEICLRMHTDADKLLYVKKEGPGELKAGDLQVDADVEVMNPDLHIATLDKDGVLDMEVTVGKGRGYVLAEANKQADQPMGTIVLDAAFSPIRKVHYEIDNARVGQQTDYDKLSLAVWTNSVVRPDDAVAHAARILKNHLELFINFEEEPEEELEEVVDEETRRIATLLKMPVDELELSVRSANCLKAANIITLEDLVQKTENEMLKFRNFGRKSLNELTAILENLGIAFGIDVSKYQDVASKSDHISILDDDF
ncbi:MAG: DNA-directed RNA polymerase subunit alpha [Gemmatimonadetes bacterium]|nr:DNA-directed RNA polymerase subunit alpha [Gemmatimonadota bacterium]MXZ11917.1 DNA-directed RNA polymerase subunit alpha [Gemmatimonadota bacterium]MYB58894.1 DNA-directed RNA polymerase subunit alpha [Gemmatimonadota bacterium]MYC16620.1 DNA-directed RNA polymerase subunit alpha [Gemmatimonadota bacterium]MYD63151.1 DNA-directed RNA polymerase subunit alpha [Gemmatimonadota bacterium]